MNRRLFLRSIFRATAAAFAAPVVTPAIIETLNQPQFEILPHWTQNTRLYASYSDEYIEMLTDAATKAKIQQSFLRYYHEHTPHSV